VRFSSACVKASGVSGPCDIDPVRQRLEMALDQNERLVACLSKSVERRKEGLSHEEELVATLERVARVLGLVPYADFKTLQEFETAVTDVVGDFAATKEAILNEVAVELNRSHQRLRKKWTAKHASKLRQLKSKLEAAEVWNIEWRERFKWLRNQFSVLQGFLDEVAAKNEALRLKLVMEKKHRQALKDSLQHTVAANEELCKRLAEAQEFRKSLTGRTSLMTSSEPLLQDCWSVSSISRDQPHPDPSCAAECGSSRGGSGFGDDDSGAESAFGSAFAAGSSDCEF
jgi:hypothetical protein